MAQVRWSLTAASDLQDIENFIARDSVLHAISFVDRIVAQINCQTALTLVVSSPNSIVLIFAN